MDQEELHKLSLESVVKVMFGSCTTGVSPAVEEPLTNPRELSPRTSRSNTKSSSPDSVVDPDNLYRTLFTDNHLRAEEAVAHLREQLDHQRKAVHRTVSKGVPGVFHVSSPARKVTELPTGNEPAESKEEDSAIFDDGISVITQTTLDLIFMDNDDDEIVRVRSDMTQDPIDQVEESWKQTVRPRNYNPSSPLRFGRSSNRSHCTVHTKRSQGTKGTKSTESTQTCEFANVWQQDEKKYWDDVVMEEEGGFATQASIVSGRQKKIIRAREASKKARLFSSNRSSAEVSK